MAINNPKPSVDYSLFFDGLGRASLAFVPKCCDNAFLPAKGAAASKTQIFAELQKVPREEFPKLRSA